MEVALDIEIYFSHPHVHSKLRNGTTKGGRGNSRTSNTIEKNNSSSSISSGNGGSTPSTSPTAFLPPRPEKRKSKDEPSSPTNVDNDASSPSMVNASGIPISLSAGGLVTQPQSLINPVTGLNVQISTKKCKTSSPCAVSPVLLECPEQDCSKKYKHANGLRYHQSHAHGNGALLDDDCMVEVDEPPITPLNSPVSLPPTSVVSEVVTAAEPLKVSEFSALKISDQSEMCSALSEVQGISLPFVHLENSEETESYVDSIEHTPADSQSNSSKVVPTSNISLEPSRQGQNSQISSSDSSNINNLSPLEQSNVDHTAPGKTGVLRFGQAESKINNVSLLSVQAESKSNCNDHDPLLPESSSPVSDPHTARSLSKDGNKTQQKPNSDSYNISGDTCTQNCRDEGDIQGANKVPPSMSCGSKQKKNRKSPMPNELEVDRFNACNVSSREDVQSPAYSDISDDSTPVNDQQLLERNQPSKNPDLNKKSTDVVLPSGSGCTTSVQTTMPSPLGGYGVYQFYQQQQFLIQPPIEQHQSNKSNTNTITQSPTALSGTPQQPSNLTEFNRKDPALDLISKSSAPTIQVLSPSSHEISKDIPQANISSSQGARGLALAPGALSSSTPSKSVSHFYAFNYMSPGYPFNVDQNYAPVPITADDGKLNRHSGILSPTDLQQSTVLFKDDRGKELNIPNETVKALQQQQISSNKPIKSELIPKSENIKTDSVSTISSQVSHHPLHTKDLQGMGVYTNMYQRHPMTLTSHQLSREEELRRAPGSEMAGDLCMGGTLNIGPMWSKFFTVDCRAKFGQDQTINVDFRAPGPEIGRDLCMGGTLNTGPMLSTFFTVHCRAIKLFLAKFGQDQTINVDVKCVYC